MRLNHQVFLIARITPHGKPLSETRYRCVGALHHWCCYGHLALKAATRYMTLIKQKENAEIIREEINGIHGLYGTFSTPPEPPEVPCPFTHFLMYLIWTSNPNDSEEFPEELYGFDSGCALPAGIGTTERDNSDGITIIDVTDPESPAYCFVSIRGLHSTREPSDFQNMTPLSATQYARAYHPEVEMDGSETPFQKQLEQYLLKILRPFESVPMITIDMLAEAWPGEYTPNGPHSSGLSLESKMSSATSSMLPSLVELTFVPALNHALQAGGTDYLDPFMLLPSHVSKIKETFRAHNSISEFGFTLLSKFIPVDATSIDLSHFSLTGEQLTRLLSIRDSVEVLNLSHMPQMTTDILRQLITILPNLRRLVLLHTIPDADILCLLSESPELFYRIESLIHSAFLRPLDEAIFPVAFSHFTAPDFAVSLPYFTPGQLVQALTDCFSLLRTDDFWFISRGSSLMAMYASAVREPGRSLSERIVPFIPSKTIDIWNKREGWFFAWSAESYRYAFVKINKEAREEFQQRINEPFFHTTQKYELDTRLDNNSKLRFHIFDVKDFFQELIKEGRPAPSPEALTKLLDIFAASEKDNLMRLMTPADLISFLEEVEPCRRRYWEVKCWHGKLNIRPCICTRFVIYLFSSLQNLYYKIQTHL